MNAKKFLESDIVVHGIDGHLLYGERSQGRYRYIVVLQTSVCLSDTMSKILIQKMRSNPVLDSLTIGKDYQFGGLSVIAFRYKEHAALFKMFFIKKG